MQGLCPTVRWPAVCKLKDDAQPYYEKIMETDAVVIGTPVYMDTITSTACAFVERFFGYRHVDVQIAGKPFVTVRRGRDNDRRGTRAPAEAAGHI